MLKTLEKIILPTTCVVTGKNGGDFDLSPQIISQLIMAKELCPICAELSLSNKTCGKCLQKPPIILQTQVGFLLNDVLKEMIHQYKFSGNLFYSDIFAKLLAPKITPSNIDALIPVPLHIKRLSSRGFNQSLELAKKLAKIFNIPVIDIITKTVDTSSQANLTKKERQKNLRGAFSINKNLLNNINTIAIVDDVITTSSTINEIAKILHKSNPSLNIQAWAIAKTPSV